MQFLVGFRWFSKPGWLDSNDYSRSVKLTTFHLS